MPQRFFVVADQIQGKRVRFSATQAHQLRDVMRMTPGQSVLVLDNVGNEYEVTLTEIASVQARGEITRRSLARGEPQSHIVLYQALLKTDKFEWVLQKGTEIGVSEFVPVVTARTIVDSVSDKKQARWTQILTEAAEQSGRGKIPLLAPHQSLPHAFQTAAKRGGTLLMPWEAEHSRSLGEELAASPSQMIHLFIGPEGGFTPDEIEKGAQSGAQSVTLGPRILRAETAGLLAATVILYVSGDLNRVA